MPTPDQVSLLKSAILTGNGVSHGFPTRAGGVSVAPFDALNLGKAVGDDGAAVDVNLDRLCAAVGVPRARLATVSQVHGDRVVVGVVSGDGVELRDGLSGEALSGVVEADAVVAGQGVLAGVRVADCVPVLLHDPVTGVSAAVHAGWRGTHAKIVARTVEVMSRAFGVRARSLRAAIGPSIGPCCYEVGTDLLSKFAADSDFGDCTRVVDGSPRLDLWTANATLLARAGVSMSHVDRLDACTSCDPTRFYSHRRDAGRTGRHLAVIAGGRG